MHDEDGEALVFIAMKDLWIMEGQIACLESFLADPPTKEASMAMLRELRGKRTKLEKAVELYTDVDVTARRLESYE